MRIGMLAALMVLMGLNVPAAADQQGIIWGNPYLVSKKDLKVKTAADVRSRRVCVYDTTAKEIKVAGANAKHDIRGVVGKKILGGDIKAKAADGTTADDFAAADVVEVLGGVGAPLTLDLDENQTVIAGDLLICAAKGRVKKAANLSIDSGVTAMTSSAANGDVIGGNLPVDGIVVARAEEDITTGAAEFKAINVTWLAG